MLFAAALSSLSSFMQCCSCDLEGWSSGGASLAPQAPAITAELMLAEVNLLTDCLPPVATTTCLRFSATLAMQCGRQGDHHPCGRVRLREPGDGQPRAGAQQEGADDDAGRGLRWAAAAIVQSPGQLQLLEWNRWLMVVGEPVGSIAALLDDTAERRLQRLLPPIAVSQVCGMHPGT